MRTEWPGRIFSHILYLVHLANTLTAPSSANTLTGTTHAPVQSLFNCFVSVNPEDCEHSQSWPNNTPKTVWSTVQPRDPVSKQVNSTNAVYSNLEVLTPSLCNLCAYNWALNSPGIDYLMMSTFKRQTHTLPDIYAETHTHARTHAHTFDDRNRRNGIISYSP